MVHKGDIKQIDRFFAKKFPVDAPIDDLGHTALMLFIVDQNLQGIQFMLEKGASLDAVDTTGRTALHYIMQIETAGEIMEWIL